MLKTVVGAEASDGVLLQALVQELESDPEIPPDEDAPGPEAAPRAERRVAAPLAHPLKVERLGRRHRRQCWRLDAASRPPRVHVNLPRASEADTAGAMAGSLRALTCLRRRVEWERSRLLAGLEAGNLWKRLSYPSWAELLQRALGMSPKEASELMDVEGSVTYMPPLHDALREGRLSRQAVRLVRSVARYDTAGDWTAHALAATPKRLAVEVPFHLMLRETRAPSDDLALTDGGRPVPELTVPDMLARWREVFGAQEEIVRSSRTSRRARREQLHASVGVIGLPGAGMAHGR